MQLLIDLTVTRRFAFGIDFQFSRLISPDSFLRETSPSLARFGDAGAIQHGDRCNLRKHSVIGIGKDQLARGAIVHLVYQPYQLGLRAQD